jgi:transposase
MIGCYASGHDERIGDRRAVGDRRTAAAPGAAQAEGRQEAPRARPGGPHRHRLRAQDGHTLGDAPQAEMGCGSGSTCWRRLRDWREAGVWERLHRALLDRLGRADEIDWSRASSDSASVPAKRGAGRSARTRRTLRQTGLEAPPCFGPRGRPARRSAHGRQRPRLQGP